MFMDSSRCFFRIAATRLSPRHIFNFLHIFLTGNCRTRSSFVLCRRGIFRRETIFRSPESSPFGSTTFPRRTKGTGKYRNVLRATSCKSRGCNPAEAVHYSETNRGLAGITEKSLRSHFKRKRAHSTDQLNNKR